MPVLQTAVKVFERGLVCHLFTVRSRDAPDIDTEAGHGAHHPPLPRSGQRRVTMKLSKADAKLVAEAVTMVREAQLQGNKRITLDTPTGWSMTDDDWEAAVVAHLARSGKISRKYEQ